jgi:hypothetical protein
MKLKQLLLILFLLSSFTMHAQMDEKKLGSWYMYFFNADFKESQFGVQGNVQYRSWNLGSDLEQLNLRGALSYTMIDKSAKFAVGYAYVVSGTFGESNETTSENRIFQEALIPQKIINGRIHLSHRLRFEQRFVENQNFRTRYRYNLSVNVPLNSKEIKHKTYYIALYNEIFINGQRKIGEGRKVEFFDRNRAYAGIGYAINNKIRVQAGFMNQLTNSWEKGQLQLSLHQNF